LSVLRRRIDCAPRDHAGVRCRASSRGDSTEGTLAEWATGRPSRFRIDVRSGSEQPHVAAAASRPPACVPVAECLGRIAARDWDETRAVEKQMGRGYAPPSHGLSARASCLCEPCPVRSHSVRSGFFAPCPSGNRASSQSTKRNQSHAMNPLCKSEHPETRERAYGQSMRSEEV
jgi:hypothetical protein